MAQLALFSALLLVLVGASTCHPEPFRLLDSDRISIGLTDFTTCYKPHTCQAENLPCNGCENEYLAISSCCNGRGGAGKCQGWVCTRGRWKCASRCYYYDDDHFGGSSDATDNHNYKNWYKTYRIRG